MKVPICKLAHVPPHTSLQWAFPFMWLHPSKRNGTALLYFRNRGFLPFYVGYEQAETLPVNNSNTTVE